MLVFWQYGCENLHANDFWRLANEIIFLNLRIVTKCIVFVFVCAEKRSRQYGEKLVCWIFRINANTRCYFAHCSYIGGNYSSKFSIHAVAVAMNLWWCARRKKKKNISGISSRVCSCRAHQLNAWQITCVCFMSRLIEKKYTKMMRTTFGQIYTRFILGRWHHSQHCFCYWAGFIHYNFVCIIIIHVKFYLMRSLNVSPVQIQYITMLLIKLRFYRE